jgi:YVTN family beta-propeller protein
LAVAATGAMYVGDAYGAGLARGDLPSFAFPVRVPTGGVILGVAFDPSGARAFVARDSADRVAVIDVATNSVIDTINTGSAGAPIATAVSPDGQRLFVGAASALLAFDAHSFALLGLIHTGLVNHFSFHPSLPLLYASADSVLEINVNTLGVTRVFGPHGLWGAAQGTAVSSDGSELYVADEGGGMHVWDLNTGTPKDSVWLSNGFGIAVAPGQDVIYVVLEFDGSVAVVDRESRVEIARLHVGGLPRRASLDPTGTMAVVVNEGGWVDFIK